jgi:hypothetical protein
MQDSSPTSNTHIWNRRWGCSRGESCSKHEFCDKISCQWSLPIKDLSMFDLSWIPKHAVISSAFLKDGNLLLEIKVDLKSEIQKSF